MTDPLIRLATAADSAAILEWRNDEQARRASLVSDPVPLADHERWFASVLANPDRVLLVAELDGGQRKVGVCRFDIADGSAEVSINLAPGERGRGLAGPILSSALSYLRSTRGDVQTLTATIRADNTASIALFTRAGFVLSTSSDGVESYGRPV